MSHPNVTLSDLVSSLTLNDYVIQATAEIAAAKYFGLDRPTTVDPKEYCEIGGFLNVQGAQDEHQPLVTMKSPYQHLRGHLPIMLVRCHKFETEGRVNLAGWRFRSETYREEWRRTALPGNNLPDVYCVPQAELHPPDTLRSSLNIEGQTARLIWLAGQHRSSSRRSKRDLHAALESEALNFSPKF